MSHARISGVPDELPCRRTRREWYLNALRIPDSPTAKHHAETYGKDFSYFDSREQFAANAAKVNFEDWADLFVDIGARDVVMVTRHLDGYPLWPTNIPNPHMPADYRSSRDLVGDLSAAVRSRGLKLGLYYAGGTDWTFTDEPIRRLTDLLEQGALGEEYARYATAHWRELIDRYHPDVLWNDMGWPAEQDPHEIFAAYYNSVADGVVNDRWTQVTLPDGRLGRNLYLGFIGLAMRLMAQFHRKVPKQVQKNHFDFTTHEYDPPTEPEKSTWELTRGLGNSFGYNAQETVANLLNGPELIRLFVDVVAEGGNLLINVGPDGEGRIPEIQQRPLRELGEWLRINGEAIYSTSPWSTRAAATADGDRVRFTQKAGAIYVVVLADELDPHLVVKGVTLPAASRGKVLGSDISVDWSRQGNDVAFTLSAGPVPAQVAHVLAITGGSATR